MPKEIKSREEFDKLLPLAIEIRVLRPRGAASKDKKAGQSEEGQSGEGETVPTKVKIRTAKQLYTFKTTEEEVETLVKGTKVEVVEL